MANSPSPEALWASAVQSLQAGQLPQAEAALRQFVAAAPGHAEGHHVLGIVLGQLGRHDEALASFGSALAIQPAHPTALVNRAQTRISRGEMEAARPDLERAIALKADFPQAWNALAGVRKAAGETAGAEQAYRKAVTLKPDYAEAFYNLGLLMQESARLDEAVTSYRKALQLRPQFAAAHNNLANALLAAGREDDALPHYEAATRIDPRLGDAFSNLGLLLKARGNVIGAITALERAAALRPNAAAVHDNLGIAYFAAHRYADAEAAHRRALALEPDSTNAMNNLGNALGALGRRDEALAAYQAVLDRVPGHADALSNRGLALHEQGRVEEAMACYRQALEAKPDHFDALNNLGYLLQEQGKRREAMEYYRRALQANPRATRAAYNLGIAHLCEMEFGAGWTLHEARFDTIPTTVVRRAFDVPELTVEDLDHGHRVAVWGEQGVGDRLVAATLMPSLLARGTDFVLEVDPRLRPAFARANPAWRMVDTPAANSAFEGCDRFLPSGSLGRILRPDAASFGAQPVSILKSDPARREAYRKELAEPGRRLIAISWRSFQPVARGFVQAKKSASLESFATLAERSDVRLIDVQYGDTADERAAFAAQHGGTIRRVEGLDLRDDLEGVLAVIDACDLVVTTSNVTAHLGAALGKPVWLAYLADNPPFYYWVRVGEDRSPWYPSVRIVTGRDVDTWPRLFEAIHERLDA